MQNSTLMAYAESHPDAVAQGQEAIQSMLRRSATDWDFRQALLADPRAAIAEATGTEVPESVSLVFVENKADATLVLPDYVDPNAELSEEDLEAVAGGDIVMGIVVGCIVFGLGYAAGEASK